MNKLFRDHGVEQVAQGSLVGKVWPGLAASHVSLHPSKTDMYFHARIRASSLRIAKNLRTQLTDTWTHGESDTILLFRACLVTVSLFILFVAGAHELSVSMVTLCVHRPVESSCTTK
jgi:hypothetical protein